MKNVSLIKSILTVGGFTMVSRVTGFIRDVLIANFLGAGMLADAFFVAFKLPNLFRSLFAEGAFNVAFVPLFSELTETKGREKALSFATEAFSALFYVLFAFVALMETFMPVAVMIQAPGFVENPEKLAATVFMSRITFPYLLLISLNSLQSGMLNSVGKFAAAALTPTFLNLTMISSLFVFAPVFGNNFAVSLSVGVSLAGIFQLLWLVWHTRRAGLPLGLVSPLKALKNVSEEVRTLMKRILPGVFGSGIYQINLFLDTLFVSFLSTGAVSWLYYANRLYQLPVGIIGAAVGTALLPILTRQLKSGDAEEAEKSMHKALYFAVFISMPCAAGLAALNYPVISVLFERGAFTAEAAGKTGLALSAYVIGLPAYILTKTLAPAFYARSDTATPVRIAATALIVYVALCLVFLPVLGYVGIALATGVVAWINVGQYVFYIRRRQWHTLPKQLAYRMGAVAISSAVMGVLTHFAYRFSLTCFPDWQHAAVLTRFSVLGGLIAVGIVLFCLLILITGGIDKTALKAILAHKAK